MRPILFRIFQICEFGQTGQLGMYFLDKESEVPPVQLRLVSIGSPVAHENDTDFSQLWTKPKKVAVKNFEFSWNLGFCIILSKIQLTFWFMSDSIRKAKTITDSSPPLLSTREILQMTRDSEMRPTGTIYLYLSILKVGSIWLLSTWNIPILKTYANAHTVSIDLNTKLKFTKFISQTYACIRLHKH